MMAKAMNDEDKMWCGHCGVNVLIRREGDGGSVKSCNWCGKILEDETGTAEEYNELFVRFQALQDMVSLTNKKTKRLKKR